MEKKRAENSIRNSAFALGGQLLTVLAGFAMRTVFIRSLGDDYLGLNGIFESVLSLLSMAELGIGTAISFALYAPIAKGDVRKVVALMRFYKKTYAVIGLVTAALGLCLIPFLDWITNGAAEIIPHLTLIYLMFLTNTVLSYFFSYKRALITANQMHYVNTVNESLFQLAKYLLQIVVLLALKEYLLYLLIQLLSVFLSNVAISRKCDKLFPYMDKTRDDKTIRLDAKTLSSMKENVLAMLCHKLGGVVVTGTDNLLIARISISMIGLYSNYLLIVSTVANLLSQAFQAITASVGNLVALEDRDRQYDVYQNIVFVNFWIYGFCAVVLGAVVDPFVALWVGNARVLDTDVLLIMLTNFYLNGMRLSNIVIVNASGLFKRLRLKSLIEALINLVVSLYFLIGLKMGLYGVLLGTTVSIVTTNLWWESYAVYKYAFGRPVLPYFCNYALYLAVTLSAFFLTRLMRSAIPVGGWTGLILTGIMAVLTSNGLFLLCFFKTKRFVYFRDLVKRTGMKLLKRKFSQSNASATRR